MPIPARSIPTRGGTESLSTGTSTELDTHGREAALRAPTLIREDRTQREKCCVFSSSIRSHSSQVRVGLFMALLGPQAMSDLSPQNIAWRTLPAAFNQYLFMSTCLVEVFVLSP